MDYIYIGEVVNTHGLKGEIRILSKFKYREIIFKKGSKIYIGKNKEEQVINSYRFHKIYDMITLNGLNSIEDVLMYKGDSVYINRNDFEFSGYVDEDIIGLDVYDGSNKIGKIDHILKSAAHDILVVVNNKKKSYVPYVNEFVLNVDLENKKIEIKVIEGLINED
ncbi:MAG: ribosome maturation factor RimM [Ignavibacteriales bacterium]